MSFLVPLCSWGEVVWAWLALSKRKSLGLLLGEHFVCRGDLLSTFSRLSWESTISGSLPHLGSNLTVILALSSLSWLTRLQRTRILVKPHPPSRLNKRHLHDDLTDLQCTPGGMKICSWNWHLAWAKPQQAPVKKEKGRRAPERSVLSLKGTCPPPTLVALGGSTTLGYI